jgi:pSer/pThr/pTyr-binding forkhead associated (FHA) protein
MRDLRDINTVTAEGRQRTFPLGGTVRIGRAPDADVILHSPGVNPYHARVVSIGNRWWLSAEAGCCPSGSYQVQLYGGPDLDPIGRPSTVTVHAR